MSEFDEYIVHGEPELREKSDAWQTAIGLQDVDWLKVSVYLVDTARQHIEGDISIDEAQQRIKSYYDKIMLRKQSIIESLNDMLKNVTQLVHTRHRSFHIFLMNLLAAMGAYCFFAVKTGSQFRL